MDFKLNLFTPKLSSYFWVKLKQKIVNLLFLYFQFDNENQKIELISNFWSKIKSWNHAQLEFFLTIEWTGDTSLKYL